MNNNEIERYNPSQRTNHWIVAILFVLAALSGLALFHPALFGLSGLFGGGTWTRILHPFIGVAMFVFFLWLAIRFCRAQPHRGAGSPVAPADQRRGAQPRGQAAGSRPLQRRAEGAVLGVDPQHAGAAAQRHRHLARVLQQLLRHRLAALGQPAACGRRLRADRQHHRAHLRSHLDQGSMGRCSTAPSAGPGRASTIRPGTGRSTSASKRRQARWRFPPLRESSPVHAIEKPSYNRDGLCCSA